mmetsp:Transcript_19664/g.29553  ORF Transcript_19664/g.29553 Transcript_19664/m.29553 type:complete len:84 (+) Transcript_19664:799-1050(+)
MNIFSLKTKIPINVPSLEQWAESQGVVFSEDIQLVHNTLLWNYAVILDMTASVVVGTENIPKLCSKQASCPSMEVAPHASLTV